MTPKSQALIEDCEEAIKKVEKINRRLKRLFENENTNKVI